MGRRKYIFTAEMDEEIRELYLDEVGIRACARYNPVKSLADRLKIPRYRISRRALELGILAKQKKEPNWSEEELWILRQCSHRIVPTIQRYLKRAGYSRTQIGIKLKRERLKIGYNNGYSRNALSKLFGVDADVIKRWTEKGWIKTKRKGTTRTSQQGGDAYFIRKEWVRAFIIEYVSVIDFRKVDKYWLVELLTDESKEPADYADESDESTESVESDVSQKSIEEDSERAGLFQGRL